MELGGNKSERMDWMCTVQYGKQKSRCAEHGAQNGGHWNLWYGQHTEPINK